MRILLLEDEESIRGFVRINLKRGGMDVAEAGDGETALMLAEEASPPFDIALLDVMLPGISGFEVCGRLRERFPRMGIIMLTAKTQEEDKIRGLELGADDYVQKPFSPGELVARVNALHRRMMPGGLSWPDAAAHRGEATASETAAAGGPAVLGGAAAGIAGEPGAAAQAPGAAGMAGASGVDGAGAPVPGSGNGAAAAQAAGAAGMGMAGASGVDGAGAPVPGGGNGAAAAQAAGAAGMAGASGVDGAAAAQAAGAAGMAGASGAAGAGAPEPGGGNGAAATQAAGAAGMAGASGVDGAGAPVPAGGISAAAAQASGDVAAPAPAAGAAAAHGAPSPGAPAGGSARSGELLSGPFRLSAPERRLWKNGAEILLTPTEWTLVKLLMEREGEGLSRDDILSAVWGRHFIGDLKIVDVNIRRIRQKLEDEPSEPRFIETLWGYGYRWKRGE